MDQLRGRAVRLWIVWYEGADPTDWRQVPPGAIAQCEAFDRWFDLAEAAQLVEGFNKEMLLHPNQRWLVALWVALASSGDFEAGEPVEGRAIDFGGWPA
jgi:hypothetical protein